MPIEQLHEPVPVRADFSQSGSIRPVRFEHAQREYVVIETLRSWSERDGERRRFYFNVKVTGAADVYQLLLETPGMVWYLEAVILE